MAERLQDQLAYPPRGLRAERAAAYVGVSKTTFLELVEDGVMPKPIKLRGCMVWDRLKIDAAIESMTDDKVNSFDRKFGIRR